MVAMLASNTLSFSFMPSFMLNPPLGVKDQSASLAQINLISPNRLTSSLRLSTSTKPPILL